MLAVAVIAVVGHLIGVPPLPPVPRGTWACTLQGEFIGTLSIQGLSYDFLAAGRGTAEVGSFAVARARLGSKSKASLVRVWSGPLRETFGIKLGLHNRTAEPETLVFNIGPGKGLQCLRT